MDITLRGRQTGVDAANSLRGRWRILIVFLTANADEATLARAHTAGPYGFLTKPFRNEAVLETIRIAIQQHQRREHLFASARWLTTVMDSLTDGVIATDADGIVRYLNPAAEALTGGTPETAVGQAIEAIYPLSDLAGKPVETCLLRRVLATGEYIGKAHLRLGKRSGATTLIEDSAAPIVLSGKVVGAVTIFLDISQRFELERQKELERDRLEEEAQTATEALGQTRTELRALASNWMTKQEREWHRIARELHNDIGQRAAILNMLIDQAEQQLGRDGSPLSVLRKQTRDLATAIRVVSHQLHPSIIEDLGVPMALESLVEQD